MQEARQGLDPAQPRSSGSLPSRSNDFGKDVAVPGFRPGRAPRQLVIKRFKKQVSEQVKSSLLMASLEQLDEDYELNPITQPKLDVAAIELPEDGPMNFEIDVEVRPEFALPEYKGLALQAAGPADHRGGYRDLSPAAPRAVRPGRAQARGGRGAGRLHHGRPGVLPPGREPCSTRSRRSSSASSRRCGSATARSPSWARRWRAPCRARRGGRRRSWGHPPASPRCGARPCRSRSGCTT